MAVVRHSVASSNGPPGTLERPGAAEKVPTTAASGSIGARCRGQCQVFITDHEGDDICLWIGRMAKPSASMFRTWHLYSPGVLRESLPGDSEASCGKMSVLASRRDRRTLKWRDHHYRWHRDLLQDWVGSSNRVQSRLALSADDWIPRCCSSAPWLPGDCSRSAWHGRSSQTSDGHDMDHLRR